ncbi:hypothetical protein ACSMXN_06370 [Jatrophihabitans sp. DSM 45814]
MGARTYEVRVRGPIPPDLLAELGVIRLMEEPAQTVLETEPIDQASLHALLERLRWFSLELLELRRTSEPGESAAAEIDDENHDR